MYMPLGFFLPGSKHEDAANCIIKFKNGCIASLNSSRITQKKIRELSISQVDSYIALDFTTQDLQIIKNINTEITTSMGEIRYLQKSVTERLFIHKANPLQVEIEHFINSIKNNISSYETNKKDLEILKVATSVISQIHQNK